MKIHAEKEVAHQSYCQAGEYIEPYTSITTRKIEDLCELLNTRGYDFPIKQAEKEVFYHHINLMFAFGPSAALIARALE